MKNEVKCQLCGRKLIEKNPWKYGKLGAECHISRHHLFPKRLRKYFNQQEIVAYFSIKSINQKIILCYQCHEEVLHNIILSPIILKKLNKKMKGKNIKNRIKILYKQLL